MHLLRTDSVFQLILLTFDMDQTTYGLGVEDSATKWHAVATGAIFETSISL